jgi:hypothetical protein
LDIKGFKEDFKEGLLENFWVHRLGLVDKWVYKTPEDFLFNRKTYVD